MNSGDVFKFGYHVYRGYIDDVLCDYVSIPYSMRDGAYRIADSTLTIQLDLGVMSGLKIFNTVKKLYDEGMPLDMIKDYMEL